MIDLCLRAESEADLAAALPMLRRTDEYGAEVWITGSMYHAFDVGITVVTSPAVVSAKGKVTKPAVLADGFHANLRLADTHPDRNAILAGATPFRVSPVAPQRVFA